ncbi:MAG: hypothetical protein V1800_02115 [Candidatus Latescibacterota bacterium]
MTDCFVKKSCNLLKILNRSCNGVTFPRDAGGSLLEERSAETQIGITHVMEPLVPGCYGVLTVAGSGANTRVYAFSLANGPTRQPGESKNRSAFPRKRVELAVVQRTGECLTVDVPKGPFRSMGLSVEPVFDPSSVVWVNRPRVDWCYPRTAVPKQPLRLIGRGLVSAGIYRTQDPAHPVSFGGIRKGKTTVVARRDGGKTFVVLPVMQSSYYEAWLEVPSGLKPGRYEIFAHNGLGGEWGWSEPMSLTVERPARRSVKVFRVDDYLLAGQPTGHTNFDIYGNYQQKGEHLADGAIRQAIEVAAAHGGGVVEFSGGVYDIGTTIVVPPGVTLRGQGADRTWLRTPFGDGPRAPYVVITGDGDFAVEDIEDRNLLRASGHSRADVDSCEFRRSCGAEVACV